MDFARPVEAIIPGAQGKVLNALAQITGPVSLRRTAEIAGVSPAQCSRLLGPLVELGIVEREDVPPAAHFRLVREHLAARPLLELVDSHGRFMELLGRTARRLRPPPASVIVFGSLARGTAHAGSDIDVLLVRQAAQNADETEWHDGVADWIAGAEQASGNPVRVVEAGEREARSRLRSRQGMWASIRREGLCVSGVGLDELTGGRRAPKRSDARRVARRRAELSGKG